MELTLLGFLAPLLGAIVLSLPFKYSEKVISYFTLSCFVFALWSVIFLFDLFISNGFIPFELEFFSFMVSGHSFLLTAWVDKFALIYGMTSLVLAMVVTKCSHSYLHREKGYQRFFATILFFVFGLIVLSFAGHLDLFFAGWEIVGFSSFLLISYYRHHPRSVNNAFHIYCLYRICDVGLLTGAVLGHLLWKEAASFSVLSDLSVQTISENHGLTYFILCLCLVLASLGKSAQFPFHQWPARAMEGPTPSSAIFYGALSIHAGLLLLIRTEIIWSSVLIVRYLVGGIGLITIILSYLQTKIQSNIKGKIAYKITKHIGAMFILLSLGLTDFVFGYMILHAFYRCFELLVSPSVIASSENANSKEVYKQSKQKSIVSSTLYYLTTSDFGMHSLVLPISFPKINNFLNGKLLIGPLIGICLMSSLFDADLRGIILASCALIFSLKALFYARKSHEAMIDIFLSLVFLTLSYGLDSHGSHYAWAYLLPISFALLLAMGLILKKFPNLSLSYYHGKGSAHPLSANLFMLCFMVMAGMPISSAFVAEDMVIEYLLLADPVIGISFLLILMLNGMVLAKIYTKIFMGRVALILE